MLFVIVGFVMLDWCCRLESTALLLADELNAHQALGVVETMEEMQCRNLQLINKYEVIRDYTYHHNLIWVILTKPK